MTSRVDDYFDQKTPETKYVILRHDIDAKPENALKVAKLEYDLGIKSTYYFRIINPVYNKETIMKINELGHEIGYHYEVLAKERGNKEKAILNFEKNLNSII